MSLRSETKCLRASARSRLGLEDRQGARRGARRPLCPKPVQVPEPIRSSNHPQGRATTERSKPRKGSAMFVGIEVSKDRLDVAVHGGKERWQFGRDESGLARLIEQLRALEGSVALVVLEATGGLERDVAAALAVAKIPAAVVNARQVRDFARATGKLAKTDGIDAAVLAHFAEAVRPAVQVIGDELSQA